MVISKTLDSAIKENNLVGIHSVFYTIAHEDPAFKTSKFDETFEYVKQLGIKNFIEDDNNEPLLGEQEWTEEYWGQVASQMQDNFSIRKIKHLKAVGKSVYNEAYSVENQPNTRINTGIKEERQSSFKLFLIGTSIITVLMWLIRGRRKRK